MPTAMTGRIAPGIMKTGIDMTKSSAGVKNRVQRAVPPVLLIQREEDRKDAEQQEEQSPGSGQEHLDTVATSKNLAQACLGDSAQNDAQYDGNDGKAQRAHDKADDAKDEKRPHVIGDVIQGKDPDRAIEQDHRRQHVDLDLCDQDKAAQGEGLKEQHHEVRHEEGEEDRIGDRRLVRDK